MSDIVFVLGAGASFECGGPLMTNFLDVARRILDVGDFGIDHGVGDGAVHKAHFERVFAAIGRLQRVHSKAQLDIQNIESIFTTVEMAKTLGSLPGTAPEEIDSILESLRHVIFLTLERRISFPTIGTRIEAPPSYEALAGLVAHLRGEAFPAKSISILTFNYDVAVDVALHASGHRVNYGLDSDRRDPNELPLLKLHGSLNWAIPEDTGPLRVLDFREYFQHHSARGFRDERGSCTIPVGSQLQKYFRDRHSVTVRPYPMIVPPTWNKADHHRTLAPVWAAAARELREARAIYVLGYSLPDTDQFFRLLYALGTVGDRPLERFMVCNPDTSVVEARFRAMLGPGAAARFDYQPWKFSDAIHRIAGHYPKRPR